MTTGIDDAVEQATATASATGKDVALMGSGTVAAALGAGLLDEVIIHQVPVPLGGGTPFFQALPAKVQLRRLTSIIRPGSSGWTSNATPARVAPRPEDLDRPDPPDDEAGTLQREPRRLRRQLIPGRTLTAG